MRIIKFRKNQKEEFVNYVDIGSCERDFYYINFYLLGSNESRSGKLYFKSYNEWFENFKNESIGSKMLIINYYLSEYFGWNIGKCSPQIEYCNDIFGEKTTTIISNNLDFFLNFNNKWFYHESSLFKCLDFDRDDIEETILSTEETEDGLIKGIVFEDGSEIQFTDDNESIKSFFVSETKYLELKNEIDFITNKFK